MKTSHLKMLVELKANKSNPTAIRKLLSESTVHGLSHMFQTERVMIRLMWIILFLSSVGFTAYLLYGQVLDYFNYSVVTSINIIYESPTLFPTITFYNLNRPQLSLKEMLIKCNFNENVCDDTYFDRIYDPPYVYFQFNGAKNQSNKTLKKSTHQGKVYGLNLMLFGGMIDNYTWEKNHFSEGFRLIVSNASLDPGLNLGISDRGIDLPLGFETNVAVKRVFDSKLEYPYNDCYKNLNQMDSFDSDLFRSILNSTDFTYRQMDCFDYCLGQEIIKKCPEETSTKSKNFKQIKPVYLLANKISGGCVEKTYYNLTNQNLYSLCRPVCPMECDSISYELSTSFSLFPSDSYAEYLISNSIKKSKPPTVTDALQSVVKKLGRNLTVEYLQRTLISLNVFYEEFKFTSISQVPEFSFVNLIANIGGFMGLFLGTSFLSFAELIALMYELVIAKLHGD